MAQPMPHVVLDGAGEGGVVDASLDLGSLHTLPVPALGTTEKAAPYARAVKPAMDRIGALIIFLVTLPIILVVGLLVRLTMGRGVIYKQRRVGLQGRRFTMYKFRSMENDRRKASLPYDGPDRRVCHKRVDDPRHTPVGRFLRRSSLDELPQLWNVMKGDMSLVGPRPELPHIVEAYEPWQHQRHEVKPGLTGFWQVSERAGGLAHEGVDLDIDYLDRLSFWTDVSVLLRTVPVTIRRTGS
jgi:lipopolysaccharide/colanic/teichoic acid biosynthesis glycosyltransferase